MVHATSHDALAAMVYTGRWTGSWSQTLRDGSISRGEMTLDLVVSGAVHVGVTVISLTG